MRRRRLGKAPPTIPEGKCYWPGRVAGSEDPLVPAEMVRRQCEFNIGGDIHPDHPQYWKNDPTYDLRRKRKR